MNLKLNVVVLAAGKGTRMKSARPKVLHRLAGKPLLLHVLDTARKLECANLQVVTGFGSEAVEQELASADTSFVLQEEQLGTAHAVQQALAGFEDDAVALVLYGDVPLIKADTLKALLYEVDADSMGVLTCVVDNPTGLGRIIRSESGQITRIVEEKDASESEKAVDEINTGFMAIPVNLLKKWLPRIQADNAQREYYLTDLVELAIADGIAVVTSLCQDQAEIAGINDRVQLAELERKYQNSMNEELMINGVSVAATSRV